ncbi:condensation domain-containing protein [Streptomyces sp. NPDC047525]|uniref:condensation domain-containing protein n=1 Tax=Streptomyces sp. NPDC047525 TaxID=3155264 RepID=UPI0033F3EA88
MNTHQPAPGPPDGRSVLDAVCTEAAAVLGQSPVSASDNFFALGGDSLRAGRLVLRLLKVVPGAHRIELQDIFDAADFSELATQIEAGIGSDTSAAPSTHATPGAAHLVVEPDVAEPGAGPWAVPLSYGQLRRLQRDADSVGERIPHHVSRSFDIQGPLDLVGLEAACQELVQRHGALRTGFDLDLQHGRHQAQRLDGHRLDTSRLFQARRIPSCETVGDEVDSEQKALFDLPTEVKLRVLVLLTGKNESTIVITAEHLVCDGHSFAILLSDLAALYNARTQKLPPGAALPQLPLRCWAEEEKSQQLAALEQRLAHWRTRLDPLEALPEVRLTGMRDPDVWPTTAAQLRSSLPAATVQRLRETCASQSATLFSGFVTALGLAVLDDTGQTVPGMVSPTSGRPAGWEDEVDWFASSVINRFRINTQLSLGDALSSAKQSVASGLTHAVPLPLLLKHLQFNRDIVQRWRPWLYLALETDDGAPFPLQGVTVEPAVAEVQLALRAGLTVRVDIHQPEYQDAGATVLFQYEREVWPAERAENFMATFVRMVALVAQNPSDPNVAGLLRSNHVLASR